MVQEASFYKVNVASFYGGKRDCNLFVGGRSPPSEVPINTVKFACFIGGKFEGEDLQVFLGVS